MRDAPRTGHPGANRARGRGPARRLLAGWLAAGALAWNAGARATTFLVGPGMPYETPAAVAGVVMDGDVVEIEAGTYEGGVAVWRASDLVIRGVGGAVRIVAAGRSVEGKGTWVIKGDNVRVEGIGFEGARVPDGNGAGIRFEGAGLTVRHCEFRDNENGILTGHDPDSEVLVEHSLFVDNGAGDGYTHNMYIGRIKRFTLRGSESRGARVGHQVKSRARRNDIEYNTIADGPGGRSSYLVDIPDGGDARLVGNLLIQGALAENSTLVAYAAESSENGGPGLLMANNTLVNRRGAGLFIRNGSDRYPVRALNNVFAGGGEVARGRVELTSNYAGSDPGFVDPARGDFRPRADAGIVDRGVTPKDLDERQPLPEGEPAGTRWLPRPRVGAIDLGAFEYRPAGR